MPNYYYPFPKKSAKRKKRLIFILIFPLLIFTFLSLPIWQIKKVEIFASGFTPEKIEEVKNIFSLENENIFFFSRKKIPLQEYPEIGKVSFRRNLPSTLIVKIEERKPFAVCEIENSSYLIDKEGIIMENIKKGNGKGLLNIYGIKEAEINEKRYLHPETILLIQQIYNKFDTALKKLSPRQNLKKINLTDKKNLEFFSGTVKIKAGNNAQLFYKGKSVELLLANLKEEINKVEYIDVSSPISPAVKFKS